MEKLKVVGLVCTIAGTALSLAGSVIDSKTVKEDLKKEIIEELKKKGK